MWQSMVRSRGSRRKRDSFRKMGRRAAPGSRTRKLRVELLENRTLLSTVTWNNPNGGDWNVGANWSSGSVPGASDDVIIDTPSAATVTLKPGDTASIRSLATDGNDTLSITGGSLTVAASSTLSGSLLMTGGSLTASGSGTVLFGNGSATVSSANLYAQDRAWDGIFGNFAARMGSTVGSSHAALAADATYLSQFGQYLNDVSVLLAFEMEIADGGLSAAAIPAVTDVSLPAPGMPLSFTRRFQQTISGRYSSQGILGGGWVTNWDLSAATDSAGNAVIHSGGLAFHYVKEDDGTYRSSDNGRSTLTIADGAYRIVGRDQSVFQFNENGTLDYTQDAKGNRITAGYDAAGRLISLTHSNGQYVTLTYNAQGHLSGLTDSTGSSTTYGYDLSGELLTTVSGPFGTTT